VNRPMTLALLLAVLLAPISLAAQGGPDPRTPRVLPIHDSVWLEELTWMEVRDLIAGGKRTVIIPTGGVEQVGPYMVIGKHNVILRATMDAVARKLGGIVWE